MHNPVQPRENPSAAIGERREDRDAHEGAPPAPGATPPWMRSLEALQTILTGLMLAFVFRAFFIEPFIIPSGSMAPELLGRHAALRCRSCGASYAYGLRDSPETSPGPTSLTPRCPNCRNSNEVRGADCRSGDRILVLKWPLALGPSRVLRRWDVIVFRDPADPRQSYIKRLIGLPGESLEILDGDIYVRSPGQADARIARKPAAVQERLWQPVFDQAHVPPPASGRPAPQFWAIAEEGPDSGGKPESSTGWHGLDERILRYASSDDAWRSIRFDPVGGFDFLQDFHAYNDGASGAIVGDARISVTLRFGADNAGVRIELVRDGVRYRSEATADGRIELTRSLNGSADSQLLGAAQHSIRSGAHVLELGFVDQRAYLRVDGEALCDTDVPPDFDRLRHTRRTRPLDIRIAARGAKLLLDELRIDRDVHYTITPATRRALPGLPFSLRAGEYFVLGDNSPASHDCREWVTIGPHLRSAAQAGDYRAGTVREDQIVGRAFFVYLPGVVPLDEAGRWWAPDLGRVRMIR